MNTLDTQPVDVEAIIKNIRPSKNKIVSGYRPPFEIKPGILTSGEIRFKDNLELEFGKESLAEIRFICPEKYPNCLRVGQTIAFKECGIVHGHAIITEIKNKVLDSQ